MNSKPGHQIPPASSALASFSGALLWCGLVLVLTPVLTRATSNMDLFPGWDLDPLSTPVVTSGLTPAGSMLCDVISLIGSALLFLFARARALPLRTSALVLGAIGAGAVLYHAFVRGPTHGSIADARIGMAWISGIGAALALFHAAADPRARRVALAVILGFMVLLALRGAHELVIDHPRTIADYQADRAQIIASRGWSPDSSMARAFERRLLQSDVNGWFGLSNVYGAVLAAGATMLLGLFGLAVSRKGSAGDRPAIIERSLMGLGLVGALAGVAMSQSKGGIVAGIAGAVTLGLFAWLRRRHPTEPPARARTILRIIGLLAVLGPIALVAVRGLIGERIGELSILFRWFYAVAAVKIFGANPVVGVGPDGFQPAYALAKNPISPEEVSSPHSVLLDWFAALGVFGAAWGALLLWWAWRAGYAGADERPRSIDPPSRNETRTVLAVAALATVAASLIQGTIVTPDFALLRLIGLGAWGAVSWASLGLLRRNPARAPIAAGAIAILAHGQIDVEFSWVPSCGIVLALVAIAAADHSPAPTTAPADAPVRGRWLGLAAPALLVLIALVCVPLGVVRAARWETRLLAAAETVRPVAEFTTRLRDLAEARSAGRSFTDSIERILSDLGRSTGRSIPQSNDSLQRALLELDAALSAAGAPRLLEADAVDPTDPRPRREASRLWVRHADASRLLGRTDGVARALDEALRILAQPPPGAGSPPAGLLAASAQIRLHRARLLGDTDDYRRAADALERAMALDPYNLDLARRRLRLAQELRDPEKIRVWASKCLELDRLMRLDREVRGLSEQERYDLIKAVETPLGP